ncbi:MAG: protein kinase [Planctomycetes bacterium]|nr:protein kinase [Planctomycetota bacterium]MBU4400594.1 protein kinase [Planctomycetota bacterium]
MSIDPTEIQGGGERRRAAEMSLKRGYLPTEVPGYEPERFLGVGAYGEVWVARERNTGRQVAVKFYAHRGGLDWSLLSREVEKLAFLFADRYVVQLLGVGWDSDPPYYIMEYLEKGSLADRIAQGQLPVEEAVSLFRDVATGLVHAHGKGVLHCDLKPANILLDQDGKPRLADFGQSRLSTEQAPALGTMFYMAPEQADLEAMPDARWDVYALGALLYCMLTGGPPHRTGKTTDIFERTPELTERLAHYRRTIEQSPPVSGHRRRRGVDKMLAAIVDRCLAADPEKRFPNVQSVLDALDERAARLARRPMMVLGAIGPALLLAVVTWFAYQGFSTALRQSNDALTARALETNRFAAQFAARTASNELESRYRLVEQMAASKQFRGRLAEALANPGLHDLLVRLADPNLDPAEQDSLRGQFLENPERQTLQRELAAMLPSTTRPSEEEKVASWFFCDAGGVSTVRVPEGRTIGKDFAWRSFFHGGSSDLPDSWRPAPGEHLQRTTLSDVFRSRSTYRWIVAISAPVFDLSSEKKFLGVVAMTAEVGRFVDFPGGDDQFAVLVDNREGGHKGVVLQHPLFDKLLEKDAKLPDRFQYYRVASDDLPNTAARQEHYADPLAVDAEGGEFNRRWLARMEPVRVRDADTGWIVIVQEDYETAIDATLSKLKRGLRHSGAIALGLIALVMAGLWGMAKRLSGNG